MTLISGLRSFVIRATHFPYKYTILGSLKVGAGLLRREFSRPTHESPRAARREKFSNNQIVRKESEMRTRKNVRALICTLPI